MVLNTALLATALVVCSAEPGEDVISAPMGVSFDAWDIENVAPVSGVEPVSLGALVAERSLCTSPTPKVVEEGFRVSVVKALPGVDRDGVSVGLMSRTGEDSACVVEARDDGS